MAAKQGQGINKRAVAGFAIVVVLVIAAVMVNTGDGDLQDQRYFYDLETGAMFAADRRAMPPIEAPSGAGNGVAAVVLGCDGCGDLSSAKPAWLETYTDEAKQAEAQLATVDPAETDISTMMAKVQDGHLVAAPPEAGEEPQWVGIESPQGVQLLDSIRQAACNGGNPQLCLP